MTVVLKRIARGLLAALPARWRSRLSAWRIRGRLTLGVGSFIHPTVQLLGMDQIQIGNNSLIAQDSWLNVNHRDAAHKAIVIGDHCFIGRRNVFSSGLKIEFHPYVLTANDCQFLGSTHLVSDPMRPVLSTGTAATDVIEIGANTFIGAGARVIGNVSVGHGCVIAASALVTRSVPPFSQVMGSPASVRRRYSFPQHRWIPVAEFGPQDEAALPGHQDYVAALGRHQLPDMPLIATGSDMGNC